MKKLINYNRWGGDLQKAASLFDCGNSEINQYLLDKVALSETTKEERLILLADETVIYGFVSLTIDTIKFVSIVKATYPVLKINAIGIDNRYQNQTYGTQLILATFQIALTVNLSVPIDGIYLVALRDAVDFYEKFDIKNLNAPPEWVPSQTEFQMGIEIDSIKSLGLEPYGNPELLE